MKKLLLLSLVLASGCGGSGNPSPKNWSGTVVSDQGTGTFVLSVDSKGNASGTCQASETGSVTGLLTTGRLSLSVDFPGSDWLVHATRLNGGFADGSISGDAKVRVADVDHDATVDLDRQ